MNHDIHCGMWLEAHNGLVHWTDQCGNLGELRADRIESVSFDDNGATVVMFSGATRRFLVIDGGDDEVGQWWQTAMDALRCNRPNQSDPRLGIGVKPQ